MNSPSLNQLADIVISKVQSGLKSVMNHGLSKSQIKEEIILTRNRLMVEAVAKGLIDIKQIYQNVLIEKFFQNEESKVSNRKAIYAPIPEIFFIPNIDTVEFVGSTDGYEAFKIVTGISNQFVSHDRYTAKAPTAWIQSKKVVIYNANPTRLLIRAVLNNPRDLEGFHDNLPFPICAAFGDMIIGNLVNDYMRSYRLANPQPNTQVEINQQPQQ